MKQVFMLCFMCLLTLFPWAQQTITGKVKSSSEAALAERVSIKVKDNTMGTIVSDDGSFTLTVPSLPATLIISSVGFQEREIVVRSRDAGVIQLEQFFNPGKVIVVGSTRKPLSQLQVPTSLEYVSAAQIRNAPSPDYYEVARIKKGVDMIVSSITFKTISTRGFNGSGSTRVNQLVDGMDNQAPGLNFFVGNFAGLTELDVDNIEILPGASSALYGPGGMNGTILINSKNPFKHQGFSVLIKEGVTNIDKTQRSDITSFHDFSLRYAKAIRDRFAFKIGAQYILGTDWLANDTSNYSRSGTIGKRIPGTRYTDPNYDGVNVYGDETSLDVRAIRNGNQFVDLWQMVANGIKNAAGQPLATGIDAVMALTPSSLPISRTGFQERDMIDPVTKNIKLSGALHYKLSAKTEAQLMGFWATGNSVYTGNNRYALKDIKIGQYKLEINNPNWLLRTYTTQENAGQAYTATLTAQWLNEAWKPSAAWYSDYAQAYLIPAATLWLQTANAQGPTAANAAVLAAAQNFHNMGRTNAEKDRPVPGSAQFNHLFDSVRSVSIPKGGLFKEKSQLWMTEGQYNFSDLIKFADVVVGANWKRYILSSEGTLFIDTLDAISINEVGAYAQVTRKFLKDFVTLSFSGRYDKNADFKGRFTPRATALIRLTKDNNLRISYQTAYRFASTQQKYIRLNVGDYTILGGLPWVMDYLNIKTNPVYEIGTNGQPSTTPYEYREFKPESMRSFEVGYKGWIADRLLIDAYGYFGKYSDFLGRNALYQPSTGKVFSTVVNSTTKVKTHGFGLSADYQMPGNYNVFVNAFTDVLTDVPSGFQSYFNTPKYRLNAGFGNSGMGKKKAFGFNAVVHWQDAFTWDGELANGPVDAYTTVDAQVNYKLSEINSIVKLGASNLFNKYYKTGYANPNIGGLYYLSFGFNLARK